MVRSLPSGVAIIKTASLTVVGLWRIRLEWFSRVETEQLKHIPESEGREKPSEIAKKAHKRPWHSGTSIIIFSQFIGILLDFNCTKISGIGAELIEIVHANTLSNHETRTFFSFFLPLHLYTATSTLGGSQTVTLP
jgi:hypothetical protein